MNDFRIGITGSIKYENQTSIKNILFKLKTKLDISKFTIISTGKEKGADRIIKKYALELKLDYVEYNPAYTVKNIYSIMGHQFFGKQFNPRHNYIRNSIMVKNIDTAIVFMEDVDDFPETLQFIKECEKMDMKYTIIR